MISNHQPGIISRISQEFGSPVEFSPVEFETTDQSRAFSPTNDSVEDTQFDVTLPWDLEGSDHAEEEEVNGPLHEMERTPHGTVASSLNAADFHCSDDRVTEQQQQQQQQQHSDIAADPVETQQQQEEAHKHQKSLRLRAAKYFRGPSPANRLSSSPNSHENSSTNHDNSSPNPDNLPTAKQHINRLSSPSPTSTISTQASSVSTKNAMPPRHSDKPLNFFPRTRVSSPPTIPSKESPTVSDQSNAVRASPTLSDKSNSSSRAKTEASTYSKYSDPPLYNTDDMQSTISASATSVSYGSDLENAARRILGRKRLVRGSSGYGSESDGYVSEDKETIGSGIASSKVQRQSLVQKRPSRERMLKVTGRSIGMPTRYGSDSEIESDVEDVNPDLDTEVVDVVQPLQHFGYKSDYTSDYTQDEDQQQYAPDEEDEMAAILRSNAEKNLRRSQHNNSDEEDENDHQQNGAFPSFRQDPPDVIDNSGEVYDHENIIFNEYDEDWNAVPSSSWVDPEKAFHSIAECDDEEYHEEACDAGCDPRDSLHYTESDIVLGDDDWRQQYHQHQQPKRADCTSSLEGDAGEDADSDGGQEFDGDDYFHDFSLKPDRSWGLNSQQTGWENLPSPVEFSPKRRAQCGGTYDERAIVEPDPDDDEYVTRTSEIDFFAWDDDSKANRGNAADFDAQQADNAKDADITSNAQATSFDKPNASLDVIAPKRNSSQQPNVSQSTPNQTNPHCDSDTPSRKARKGLSFFRSRHQQHDGSWNYHSEGDQSDSDWESSPNKHSFGVSPIRSTRWKSKQNIMSHRGLNFFGERRQDKNKKVEKELPLSTQYEMLRKDSEFSRSFVETASQEGPDRVGRGPEPAVVSQQTVKAAPSTKSAYAPRDESPETASGHVISELDQTLSTINSRDMPNAKSFQSNQSSTPVTNNLNDSMDTPLMSNKALNVLSRPPSSGGNNPRGSGNRKTKSGDASPRLPPRLPETPVDKKTSKRNKPPSPGFTGSDLIINSEEDDESSVSTLHTESLGSLVTRPTLSRSRAHITDDSVRSGMSEIERLRRENELLREKLENRSEASSRVSATYVRTLKEQNDLLRLHLNTTKSRNIRRNGSDMMYKSTIASLLEREDPYSRRRRSRRTDHSNSLRKSGGGRKPAHPLIHGDFDDESITTYSESVKGKKVHLIRDANCEGPGILEAIASTTQKVAAQVKTAAQERNNPSRKNRSCEPFSKPLELVSACTRKDGANVRPGAFGSTAHSTKEVIGRAFGCIKTNRGEEGSVQTQEESGSDDFIHKTSSQKKPNEKYAKAPGISIQL